MEVLIFGSDCTNSLGLAQCLGMAGFNVSALIFGENTGLVQSSRYCKHCFYFSEAKDCISFLENDYDFQETDSLPVIPSSDIAAFELNRHTVELCPKFAFGHINNSALYSFTRLLDKQLQLILAERAGVRVPQLYKTVSLSHNCLDDNGIEYPCIIKPQISKDGCKGDLRICHSFQDVLDNLSSLYCSQNILIEQYIDRDYEISVIGVSLTNGEVIMPAIEEKLTLYPKYVGLECLAKIKKFINGELKNKLTAFVKSTGYIGLFSIEMMHNKQDGKYYFTEINLRNDGANSFIFKGGVNLPLIHLFDITGGGELLNQEIREDKTGYYIWDIHHFKSLLHKDISFRQWISEIFKSKGFLTFFINDPKPFFKQYINWFLRKI